MTTVCNNFSSHNLAPSRRAVVKYGAAAVISTAAIPASRLLAADTATVSGIVYENRDKRHILQFNGGLPGDAQKVTGPLQRKGSTQ